MPEFPHSRGSGLWVFAYGSLMWAPGFPVAEKSPALLYGWRRRFSLASPKSWGTPNWPGLCAALHEGGACGGLALRVAPEDAAGVRARLRKREAAYRFREVAVETRGGEMLTALTFVWNPAEPRFLPELTPALAAAMICAAKPGRMGCSAEYLARTVAILEEEGLDAAAERRLLDAVIALSASAPGSEQKNPGHPTGAS